MARARNKNMIKALTVSLIVILSPYLGIAQVTLNSTNGPYVGTINDLVKTNGGTIIAATPNSLFTSPDGSTWTRQTLSTSSNFQDLEIHPTSGLIYAVSGGAIFTSPDASTWTQLTVTGLGVFINKLKIAANGDIWVVANNQLYRANAATPTTFFQSYTFGSTVSDLDFGTTNQIYASTFGQGVQRSTDNGVSFSPPTTGISATATVYSMTVHSGVFFAMASDAPYRSTDGTNWTNIKNNITDGSFSGFISKNASGDIFIFNNDYKKAYGVTAAGSTGSPVTWNAAVNYPINLNANEGVFSTATNWLIGFNEYGIAKTTDGGASWAQSASGLNSQFGSFDTPRLYRTTANRLLLGWQGEGYWVSTDDGATWALLNTGVLSKKLNGFVKASDNSIIGYGSGVVRSTDNGLNWSEQVAGIYFSYMVSIGSTLYGVDGTTLRSSVDNGVNWTTVGITGTGSPRKLVSYDSKLYAFANGSSSVVEINPTTGVATSFYTIPSGQVRDFEMIGSTIAILNTSTQVYVSNNNGSSWSTKSIPATSQRIWVADDQNFYVSPFTAGNLYVTIDGGSFWGAVSLGTVNASVTNMLFTTDGYAYLAGTNMPVKKSSEIFIAPKPPTNLVSLGKSVNGHYLKWDDNTTVSKVYEIEETFNGASITYTVGVPPPSNIVIQALTGIDPVTPTLVRVRAKNAAGTSAYSNQISITSMDQSCSPPAADLIPDNRSWTASTTVDGGYSVSYGCPGTVCPSDLSGTYNYSTIITGNGSGTVTGSGTMTEQNEGEYTLTDFSFGQFAAVYGDSPALGSLRFKDACLCVSLPGNDQYGDTYNISVVSVTPTDFTFNWSNTIYGDAGTTTLTRTDAKTWPALSSPSGSGPAVDNNVVIRKTAANTFTAGTYGGGISISGRPAPSGTAFFQESCGVTLFTNSSTDAPNGNSTWNPATKTLTLKWRSRADYQVFEGITTYVLNATDPVPATPALNVYVYSNTESFLNWSPSDFATSYDIERSTSSGSGFAVVATVNYPLVSYVDKSLLSGTTYYYRIKAKSSFGTSAPSSESSVTLGNSLFRPVENDIALNFENQQGVSWGDLDGDGDEDLATPSFIDNLGQTVPPVIYENVGSGQFTRRNLSVLADENTTISRGIAIFDFDNDNDLDMVITRSSSLPNLLLINEGGWTFTKQQITESTKTGGSSFRALAVIDIDKDSKLDILIGNDAGGAVPSGNFMNYVLKNSGSNFTKVNGGDFSTDLNGTVTLVTGDYDNDGDQDVFAANWINTPYANVLYKNNGDGTFTKVSGLVFDSDLLRRSRTASWGDVDNDGDLDLFVGSSFDSETNKLYINSGAPNFTFTNQGASPVAETGTSSYGSAFGDIDNDGDLDLIVSNSAANSIFINDGTGNFTKSTSNELLANPGIFHIGGSFVDFDNDGFLDYYPAKGSTGTVDLPNLLYKNTLSVASSRNWLEVKLVGTVSNRSAIGARIKVITTSPARTQIREVTSLTGYGSANSLIQHFGLGTATTATVEVRWPSGVTQTLTAQTSNQILTITEDAIGPLMTLAPTNAATNVATGAAIVLTVNEPSTKVTGKKLKVYLTSDLVTPVYSIDASAATVSGNAFTFPLPQKLLLNTNYSISVDAGMFIDIWLNPSLAIAPTNWQFTTSPGALVTLQNPSHLATNVANNTLIEITFDVPVTGVSGKKVRVLDEANTSNVLLDADATTGTITGNKVSFTPPAVLPYLKTYLVIVDPGAFVDAAQNEIVGIASGNWKFTTIEAPDLTAPVVSFTAPSTLNKGFGSIKFEVTATDNKSISSAVMFHRKVTATDYVQLVGVFNGTTSKYDFTVDETFFDATGLQYYFEFKDPSNNLGRTPAAGDHLTRLKYSNDNIGIGVTAGSTLSGYQIITVPYEEMVSTQISVLFEEFGEPDATKWRMLRYKNSPEAWEEYPNPLTTVERGVGYFVISKSGVTLKLGDVTAPSNTQSNLFSLSLKKGWNLIGNPYTSTINWADSKVAGVGDLKIFSGGAYATGNSMNIFQGGFVLADNDINVSVKLKTSPTGGRISGSDITSNLAEANWILPIEVEQVEDRFLLGGIGMSENSKITYDDLDDLAPPSLTSKLEMKFAHPEHFMKYFSRDVVPTQSEHAWTFTVATDKTELTNLNWDNTAFGDNVKDLFLMDLNLQVVINMRELNQYTFDPQNSKEFKIYYGEGLAEKVMPDRVILGNAYPNPSNKIVNIPFTVSGSDTYGVRVEVYDIMGRRVATLVDGEFKSGYYSATWDTEKTGSTSGLYTYRLLINSHGKSSAFSNKVIVNKKT